MEALACYRAPFYETAKELKDHKGDVRIFRSDDFEVQCPDVEDLEEVWKPDIKPEEAKKPPLEELKDMLLRYLQDMTERGDYTAKKLLDLIKEEDD